MKRNLIAAIAFVLIIAHIIPPNNISFANGEENNCEISDFTVQTIKEKDEKIIGSGMPSDQLTIEFKSKNKTEIVNVDANGKFEHKVEEEFLEVNDEITISNEYFKIDIKVVPIETTVETIDAIQHVQCPVVEKPIEEEVVKEEAIEKDESTVDTSEEATKEEMKEENLVAEDATILEKESEEDDLGQNRTEISEVASDNEVVEEKLPDDTPADKNGKPEKTVKDDVPKAKTKGNEEASEDTKLNSVVIESASEEIITENARKQDEMDQELSDSLSNYNLFNLPGLSTSPYGRYLNVFTNRITSTNDGKGSLLGNIEIFGNYTANIGEAIPTADGAYYEVPVIYGGTALAGAELINDARSLVLYAPDLAGKLSLHPDNTAVITSDLVGLNLSGITALTETLTEVTTGLVGKVTTLLDSLVADLDIGLVSIGVTGLDELGASISALNNIDIALNNLLTYTDEIPYKLVYDSNEQAVGVQVEFSEGLGAHLEESINLLEDTLTRVIDAVNGIGIRLTVLGLPVGDWVLTPIVNEITSTLLTPVTNVVTELLTEVSGVADQVGNVQVLGGTDVSLNLLVDNPANVPGDVANVSVVGFQDAAIDLNLLGSNNNVGQIEFPEDTTDPILGIPEINGNSIDGYTVSGTGEEAGDIVTIYGEDEIELGTTIIAEDGTYSFNLTPDEVSPEDVLTLVATDAAGNESETVRVTVPILKLVRVPSNVDFGVIEIKNGESIFGRKSTDNVIEIKDTRKNGWVLTATAPNLNDGTNSLIDALVYLRNSEEIVINETEAIVAESSDLNVVEGTNSDTITWNNNEGSEDGLLLRVNPIEAIANAEYSTTIEWTLTNSPK